MNQIFLLLWDVDKYHTTAREASKSIEEKFKKADKHTSAKKYLAELHEAGPELEEPKQPFD